MGAFTIHSNSKASDHSQVALWRDLHRPPAERQVGQRAVRRVTERQLAEPHPVRSDQIMPAETAELA